MKKSRYTLWGPTLDGYGARRWGVNDRQLYGARGGLWDVTAGGYWTRREATAELRRLRNQEREPVPSV